MTDIDRIDFPLDGAEAHVLEAALVIYRAQLDAARRLGGPALEAAHLMDGIAARVQSRLHDSLYGEGEPVEPDWRMPVDADADLGAGDFYVYPAGVGR